jgi:hypothetical protein
MEGCSNKPSSGVDKLLSLRVWGRLYVKEKIQTVNAN